VIHEPLTIAQAIAAASREAAAHKPIVYRGHDNDNSPLSGVTKTALILAAVARAMNQEIR
jgi:hypothetical protein